MKKIAIILSVVVMLSSFSSIAYAKGQNIVELEGASAKQKILHEIQELEELTDLGFELISDEEFEKNDSPEIIKVDSVEELIKIVEELQKPQETAEVFNISPSLPTPSENYSLMNTMSSNSEIYEENYSVSVWSPFSGYGMTGLACWRDFAFSFKYKFTYGLARFVSVGDIYTGYSGFTLAEWEPKNNPTYKISKKDFTDDTVTITAHGNTVLGLEVKGFLIGAKIPGTWTHSLTLVTYQ